MTTTKTICPRCAEIVAGVCDRAYRSHLDRRTIYGMEETDYGDGVRDGQLQVKEAIRALAQTIAHDLEITLGQRH